MNINSKLKTIIFNVAILIICIAASTVALYSRMTVYYIDDKGAIIINDTDISSQETTKHKSENNKTDRQPITSNSTSRKTSKNSFRKKLHERKNNELLK